MRGNISKYEWKFRGKPPSGGLGMPAMAAREGSGDGERAGKRPPRRGRKPAPFHHATGGKPLWQAFQRAAAKSRRPFPAKAAPTALRPRGNCRPLACGICNGFVRGHGLPWAWQATRQLPHGSPMASRGVAIPPREGGVPAGRGHAAGGVGDGRGLPSRAHGFPWAWERMPFREGGHTIAYGVSGGRGHWRPPFTARALTSPFYPYELAMP